MASQPFQRDDEPEILRFTRATFGLTCAPFLLGATIVITSTIIREQKKPTPLATTNYIKEQYHNHQKFHKNARSPIWRKMTRTADQQEFQEKQEFQLQEKLTAPTLKNTLCIIIRHITPSLI